jgi:hypothetical protein
MPGDGWADARPAFVSIRSIRPVMFETGANKYVMRFHAEQNHQAKATS